MHQRHSVHLPSYEGTTTATWEPPTETAVADTKRRADHFLLSRSGFPPTHHRDLELPVVDIHGELHKGALMHARQELRERPDLTVETQSRAIDIVSDLLATEFGHSDPTGVADQRDSAAGSAGQPSGRRRH